MSVDINICWFTVKQSLPVGLCQSWTLKCLSADRMPSYTDTPFPAVPPFATFAVSLGLLIMWDHRSTHVDTDWPPCSPLRLGSSEQEQYLSLHFLHRWYGYGLPPPQGQRRDRVLPLLARHISNAKHVCLQVQTHFLTAKKWAGTPLHEDKWFHACNYNPYFKNTENAVASNNKKPDKASRMSHRH